MDALIISILSPASSLYVQLMPGQDHEIIVLAWKLGELLTLLFGIKQQGGET